MGTPNKDIQVRKDNKQQQHNPSKYHTNTDFKKHLEGWAPLNSTARTLGRRARPFIHDTSTIDGFKLEA